LFVNDFKEGAYDYKNKYEDFNKNKNLEWSIG
jgi:hypothetical protein